MSDSLSLAGKFNFIPMYNPNISPSIKPALADHRLVFVNCLSRFFMEFVKETLSPLFLRA